MDARYERRACRGQSAVAVLAALICPLASGAVVFVDVNINNANAGDDPHSVTINQTGTDYLKLEDAHGPNSVFAEGSAITDAVWSTTARSRFAGSNQYRGSGGWAVVEVTITDQVLIDMPGVTPGTTISWMQPLSITGNTTGSRTSPGTFQAIGSYLIKFGGQEVAGGSQTLTENGFLSTMPDIAVVFFQAPANTVNELVFRLGASAVGWVIDNEGTSNATADYGSTFSWGEATNVTNVTTGQPIDAANFHLIGSDGFDWAHPPAIPEPATGLLVLPALALLGTRRHIGR